jgi:diguanylate cyclase (GGDEF)-like protein
MKKILLIEDNPKLLEQKLEEIQEYLEYPVLIAEDYSELVEILKTQSDDIFIALLDYHLDGAAEGQGIELLCAHKIPTIVYTEHFCNDIRESVLAQGGLDYLIKKTNADLFYTLRLIDRVYKNDFIKALIVDGSEPLRLQLSNYLEQFGIQSLQSHDAQSTMKLLKEHSEIKLLLIDLDIQGDIQGIDLVEDVREQYTNADLAILGLTPHGYNSPISIEFLKKGANDFIIKPFIKEQLNLRIMQALEMLNMIEEKHQLASTDFLTQLYNRRTLDLMGPAMIKKAAIEGKSLCVAMIDIDHFKRVNDQYGHHVGDQVLKYMSQYLKKCFRDDDLIIRNGGEEFCVILEHVSEEKALDIFESFRKTIESTPYSEAELNIPINISIGLYYGLKETMDDMLSVADERLYLAKARGRNQIVF